MTYHTQKLQLDAFLLSIYQIMLYLDTTCITTNMGQLN